MMQEAYNIGQTFRKYAYAVCIKNFNVCKNDSFHLIFFYSFQIFAQYIDCGYTLEPPH